MTKIKLITDSTAYIPKAFAEKKEIEVVPLNVNLNGEFEEGFPGEFEEFYKELAESKIMPKTSQPSVGAFVNAFEKQLKNGGEIIAILLSSKLSGTYNSAMLAVDMMETGNIAVIDSGTTAGNLRFLIEEALELIDAGKKRDEIIKILNQKKKETGIFLTVDTLEYLKKGGRLSSTQAAVGTLLNIRPIIAVVDGKLEAVDKVRGKSKAVDKILNSVPIDATKISVFHILSVKEAETIKEKLIFSHKHAEITIDELGPVIGSHLGPKAVGICYYK